MSADEFRYDDYNAQAKATKAGHLHIGRGGFKLCHGSLRLSGYGCDRIKALYIAARLPVIDSRAVSINLVTKNSVSGPMIAVNAEPDPYPWHALSYASIGAVAAAYRRAGADVLNIEESSFDERGFADVINPSLAALLDGWLAYIRRAA